MVAVRTQAQTDGSKIRYHERALITASHNFTSKKRFIQVKAMPYYKNRFITIGACIPALLCLGLSVHFFVLTFHFNIYHCYYFSFK